MLQIVSAAQMSWARAALLQLCAAASTKGRPIAFPSGGQFRIPELSLKISAVKRNECAVNPEDSAGNPKLPGRNPHIRGYNPQTRCHNPARSGRTP